MDAARLMIADHRVVTDLLSELDSNLDATAAKGKAVRQLTRRLHAHVAVAEQLLLPELRARASDKDLDGIQAAEATNRRIGDLLVRLEPGSAGFERRLRLLENSVVRHIDEEETVIVPRAEDLLSDGELIDLGERMAQREAELLAPPFPDRAARVLRTVALIVVAGVALAVVGRLRRR